jgi:hypothetical protein
MCPVAHNFNFLPHVIMGCHAQLVSGCKSGCQFRSSGQFTPRWVRSTSVCNEAIASEEIFDRRGTLVAECCRRHGIYQRGELFYSRRYNSLIAHSD